MSAIGPLQAAGALLVLAYLLWLGVFIGVLRQRLMRALGRRLGVAVEESTGVLDSGTYGTHDAHATLGTHALLTLADLLVLLAGTVGVAAAVFVPVFLQAESGALDAFEGRLTGRSATLRAPAVAALPAAGGQASLAVEVHNDGRRALERCRLDVSGTHARNGYLTGSSPWFDLAVGARRRLRLDLHAQRQAPGDKPFRVRLECAFQRLRLAPVRLHVAP